jgi:hypothetical protein
MFSNQQDMTHLKINTWQELENFANNLILFDNPVKPAGSGNSKQEEDVVGKSLIIQCKFSSDKNLSLLRKDIYRLFSSSELLNKFPIFITSNDNTLFITFSYNAFSPEVLKLISINKLLGIAKHR